MILHYFGSRNYCNFYAKDPGGIGQLCIGGDQRQIICRGNRKMNRIQCSEGGGKLRDPGVLSFG